MVQTTLDLNSILTTLVTSMVGGGAASAAFWALAREKMREIFVTKEAYARDEAVREQVIVKPLERVAAKLEQVAESNASAVYALTLLTEEIKGYRKERMHENQ